MSEEDDLDGKDNIIVFNEETKRNKIELVDVSVLDEDSTIYEEQLVEDRYWKEEITDFVEFPLLEFIDSSRDRLQLKKGREWAMQVEENEKQKEQE